MLAFRPRPHLVVAGPAPRIAAIADKDGGGGPDRELAALLPGDGVLAQLVYGRGDHRGDDVLGAFGMLFGDDDDPVDFVRIRLRYDDADTVTLQLRLRFRSAGNGPGRVADSIRQRLSDLRDDPRLLPMLPLLDGVAIETHDGDLDAALPLGTPRQVVSRLERAFLASMAQQASPPRARR